MPTTRRTLNGVPKLAAIAVASALITNACGSDGDDADEATSTGPAPTVASSEAAQPATSEDADPIGDDPSDEASDMLDEETTSVSNGGHDEPEADHCSVDVSAGERSVIFPTMGGICAQLDDDVLVFNEADFVRLRRDGDPAAVVVGRVGVAGQTSQVRTVDDFVGELESGLDAEVEPVDETIEVLGLELQLHEIRDAQLLPGPGLFSPQPLGFGGNEPWSPAPNADLYLGEVAGGVLALGSFGPTVEDLAATTELVEQLATSLRWTTSTGAAVAPPDPSLSIETLGEANPIEPIPDAGGPPALLDPFTEPEAGDYQLPNLEPTVTVDVDGSWFVAPNFPGIVVFADPPTFGPAFRDIILLSDTTAVSGVDLGPTTNTGPFPIDDIDAFLENPPTNLIISDVVETAVGDRAATRFDVRVDPGATCRSGDPCNFFLTTSQAGNAAFWTPNAIHRVWLIEDEFAGTLSITASASDGDEAWLDERAVPLVESLSLAG